MDQSDALLTRLASLHPREIDLSLGRIERLLNALDRPERRVPPVIHVAGTNGKGSVVAFLRAMLEAAGLRVHAYTSPHLVRFHERIRLAGTLVSEADLSAALSEIEQVNDGAPITLFEITTAAAFMLFSRTPADVLLLEVGLGGRLDATNVIDAPLASIITPVSLDHTRFLGETLSEIAAEKAGILKRGVPAIVAAQADEAARVIERAGARAGALLHLSGRDWHVREENARLIFEDENGLIDLPLPRLAGRHQHENAGAALAALRAISAFSITTSAMEAGIAGAVWPARLQRIGTGPLHALIPPDSELWLDGAHNPAGGRALAAALAEIEERVPRPLVLVVGMLDTKDSDGFLEAFRGLVREVRAVPIASNDHALKPQQVAAAAEQAGLSAIAYDSLEAALAAPVGDAPHGARLVIAGSLYLAGEVLRASDLLPA